MFFVAFDMTRKIRKYSCIILLFAAACNDKNDSDPEQVCTVKPKKTIELTSNNFVQEKQDSSQALNVDSRTVILTLGKFTSQEFPEAKNVADSALHIASVLLSSNDFKKAIGKLDFTCRNYWHYCKTSCNHCDDRFSGMVVLDSVFRKNNVQLDLFLQDCNDEYGHSTRNVLEVYSCKPVVFFDEKELSPAYCYAYHLAHEYMHIVGFFHTDHVDDVAEKTGWIGWEIILAWRRAGRDIMQLKPGQI